MIYIPRKLVINRFSSEEKTIEETELVRYRGHPIVVLGQPGIGKTELTKSLEQTMDGLRVGAGKFSLSENLEQFKTEEGGPLIIDGLDELTVSSTGGAIDEVLRKLSQLNSPSFIISCRSADWQGARDRHLITQHYDNPPLILNLEPFSREDALSFLKQFDEDIDGEYLLNEVNERHLDELVGNPLTLQFLAQVISEDKKFPENKAELLERICGLLIQEVNDGHANSKIAQSPEIQLLMSAGAIFAHLLLSGSLGVSVRPRQKTPKGYIHLGDLTDLPGASLPEEIIKTRLFCSEGEGLFVPVHRIVAEYLSGRWLGQRLSEDLSERRLFQVLTIGGTVPGALRGLHAWLVFFSSRVAARCIGADPYGVLRYGEPDALPAQHARMLLGSLIKLSEDDPYFRSEDWGVNSVLGIVRPELKDDIVCILKHPGRPFHLSSLILRGLSSSPLTDDIVLELTEFIESSTSSYEEKLYASEALISRGIKINWPEIVAKLQASENNEDKILAIEIIASCDAETFSEEQVVDALINYTGFGEEPVILSRRFRLIPRLIQSLPDEKCAQVLDILAERMSMVQEQLPDYINNGLSTFILGLVEKSLQTGLVPRPERFWSWLKFIRFGASYITRYKDGIKSILLENTGLRRDIQKHVIYGNEPYLYIVYYLGQTNEGLSVTTEDAVHLLKCIGEESKITKLDIQVFSALLQSQYSPRELPDIVVETALGVVEKHQELNEAWNELKDPRPIPKWELEQQERNAVYQEKKAHDQKKYRESFLKNIDQISSGEAIVDLANLARASLGYFGDVKAEDRPFTTIANWVGEDIAGAASSGFVESLYREDIPNIALVSETGSNGRELVIEAVIVCGIVEAVLEGKALGELPLQVARCGFMIFQKIPRFAPSELHKKIEKELKGLVLTSADDFEEFYRCAIEPYLKKCREHIPYLYWFCHDPEYFDRMHLVAIDWLIKFPETPISVQTDLIGVALNKASNSLLRELIMNRLYNISAMNERARRVWLAAAFVIDIEDSETLLADAAKQDPELIWSIMKFMKKSRRLEEKGRTFSFRQIKFVVELFGANWPYVQTPSGWSGSTNPWDATQHILNCINELEVSPLREASEVLDSLLSNQDLKSYQSYIKHAKVQQARMRLEKEFVAPSFDQVKAILLNEIPRAVDDIKAATLDALDSLQNYIRNSDSRAWDAYWNSAIPKDENTCRDRILDELRHRLPGMNLFPECNVPELKRTDMLVSYQRMGLPVEIKGQWHPELWNASSAQLDDDQTRDWRADGRGVYLVLWIGNVPGKNLPRHPDGLPAPSISEELRMMLEDRLKEEQRGRIDVVVLDVAKPLKN